MGASTSIYGSVHVRLVQFCFIFCFMLIYPWEPRLYLYSLPQYIFCILLWFNKNTFPHSSELRKTSNSLSIVSTFVLRPRPRHIWLSILPSFVLSHLYLSPQISAAYICLDSRPQHCAYIETSIYRILHLTLTLLLLEGLLANSHLLIFVVVVVFVLVSDHIDITGISAQVYIHGCGGTSCLGCRWCSLLLSPSKIKFRVIDPPSLKKKEKNDMQVHTMNDEGITPYNAK